MLAYASIHFQTSKWILAFARMTIYLPAQHVRRPPCIRTAVEHTVLVIGHDGAHRACEPRLLGPLVDLVPEVGELIASRLLDARFDVEPARVVRMWLERSRI